MTDIASLGMEIDSTSANTAADALDRLDASQKRVVTSTQSVEQANANARYAAQKATEDYQRQSATMGGLSLQAQKLLDRYDSGGAILRRLQSEFALLNKEVAAGAGAGQEAAIDLTYKRLNDEIAKTRGLMQQAGVGAGFEKAADAADRSAFATAGARRELIVLGHEALTGNFSRMPGSFMVLTERIGASGLALTGIVGAIGAVIGSALLLGKAFADGHKEMTAMNNALAISGDFAGQTRGSMRELALQIASTGTMSVGTAKSIVTELVASGQIGAAALGNIAKLASNYAAATGKDIDKIAPDLVRLFEDPVKGAAELNKQMHFLSSTEQEHIAHLVRQGQEGEAQLLLAQRTADFMPKIEANLGSAERGWNKLKAAASGAWDAFLGIGREQTLQEKLTDAQKILDAKIRASSPGPGPASPVTVARLTTANQGTNDIATYNLYSAMEGQVAQTSAAEKNALDNKSAALVRQTAEYQRIAELNEKIKLAGKYQAQTAEEQAMKDQAIRDLKKQAYEVDRAAGADARAVLMARTAGTEALGQIENKNYLSALNTQLKLGGITQDQFNERAKAAEVYDIQLKEIATRAQLAQASAYGGERETLRQKLLQLDAEKRGVELKYVGIGLLEQEARLRAQADADARSAGATATGQLTSIDALQQENQKIQDRNDAIGKTKAQVDQLKASELDRALSRLEYDRTMNEDDEAYIARLDKQIELLRKQQDLQKQGATLQTAADAQRQYLADWKRANDEISRALTDGLMRSFEAGKTFAQSFRDTLLNMFKTLILRPIIQWVTSPISGAMTGIMQGMGFSSAAGTASSGLSMASGANTVSGWFGGPSIGPGSLGGMFAGITTPGMTTSGLATADMALGGLGGAEGAAGLAAGGLEAGGALAGASGAMAAMGPVGWAALAAVAAMAIFGGDSGGPKASDSSLRRRADGSFGVEMNNVAGGDPDMSQVTALNAMLNDKAKYDPAVLARLVDTQVSTGSPADTSTLINALTQKLAPAAQSAADAQTNLAAQAQAAADALQSMQQTVNAAIDDQTNAVKAAATGAKQIATTFRQLATTLQDTANSLKLGNLSPLSPLDQLNASRSILTSVFSASLGGDQAALTKLPTAATDFLNASRAYFASSVQYAQDFQMVMTMLDQAQAVSNTVANVQDQIYAIQTHQVEILGAIKEEVSKAHPDPAVLEALNAQLVTGQAQADMLQTTLDGQLSNLRATFDASLAINTAALGSGTAATIAALDTSNAAISSVITVTNAAIATSVAATGVSIDTQTSQLASLLSDGTRRISELLQQLIDLTRGQSAQDVYNAAKAQSDSLRDTQLAYVNAHGGGFAAAEDIESNRAQQVSYQLGDQTAIDMGSAYGAAFERAYALYKAIPGHATGLDRVPRDNYLAFLHQDERVLTAREARSYNSGGGTDPELKQAVKDLGRQMAEVKIALETASHNQVQAVESNVGDLTTEIKGMRSEVRRLEPSRK